MAFERGYRAGERIGLLLLLLAAAPAAWARVRPGVELGVNVSSLSYDNDNQFPFTDWDRHWLTSFTGGMTLEVPLRARFALVTGLRYVQEGNRATFDLRLPSKGWRSGVYRRLRTAALLEERHSLC